MWSVNWTRLCGALAVAALPLFLFGDNDFSRITDPTTPPHQKLSTPPNFKTSPRTERSPSHIPVDR
jgi:hypothetical protein